MLVRMKVPEEVFACYVRSCAPPPVGTGGSNKGGRGGKGRGRESAKDLTARYAKMRGTGQRRSTLNTKSSTVKSNAQKAAEKWASGKGKKSEDPRTSTSITELTKRFGTRARGKAAEKKIKPSNVEDPRTPKRILNLTAKYGGRSRGK